MTTNDSICQQPQTSVECRTLDELTPYDNLGFFQGDTLQSEVPFSSFGFDAEATPHRLRFDDVSGLLLLLCLLLAASLVLRLRKKFRELVNSIFFPIPGKQEVPLPDDPLRYSTHLVAVTLLSITAAMVTFVCTQNEAEYYLFPETPYLVLAAFFLLWAAYFLLKRMTAGFVNWVFFRKEKIFTWRRTYTFIYALEAVLFLLLALTVVYLPISHEDALLFTAFLVFFVKIIMLFKTYQIFFPKLYGTLHLIVYFCTLELIPLLVVLQVLTFSEYLLTVKLW